MEHEANMEPAARVPYLPVDSPWMEYLDYGVLKHQCATRSIRLLEVDQGDINLLQLMLIIFSRDNRPSEPRPERWLVKPPEPQYSQLLQESHAGKFWAVKIRDVTTEIQGGGQVKKIAFKIVQDRGREPYVVTFCNRPTCTCNNYQPYHCVHIMFVMRYVLNVPEPLLWQKAFLRSEVVGMYRRSHPVQALLSPERYPKCLGLCPICFKGNAAHFACFACRIGMHVRCLVVVNQYRESAPFCTVCGDRDQVKKMVLGAKRSEARAIAEGRTVPEGEWGYDSSEPSNSSSEEEESDEESRNEEPRSGNRRSGHSSNEEPTRNEASRADEQYNIPLNQPVDRRSRSPSFIIKQESPPSPLIPQLPLPPRSKTNRPASSPLRKQPSRAAKDASLLRQRQSLNPTTEVRSYLPSPSGSHTRARSFLRTRPDFVLPWTITPIPIPAIPANARLRAHQQRQQRARPAVIVSETGSPLLVPSSAHCGDVPPQSPSAQAFAEEPVAPAASSPPHNARAASHALDTAVSLIVASPTRPASPAHSSVSVSITDSTSANTNKKKRKTMKLARKLKRLAKKSADVRKHAEQEIKRLAKESKRLEKKVKALAKKHEEEGDD